MQNVFILSNCAPLSISQKVLKGGHLSGGLQRRLRVTEFTPVIPPAFPTECHSCHLIRPSQPHRHCCNRQNVTGSVKSPFLPLMPVPPLFGPYTPKVFCSSIVFLPESLVCWKSELHGSPEKRTGTSRSAGAYVVLLYSHYRVDKSHRKIPSICGLHPSVPLLSDGGS